jgi:AI-2 transport protein TqsA
VTQPSDDQTKSRTDILGSMATTLRQPSFLRVMLFLAATVVILVGIHVAAPILNPIFFAVVLTLLFSPVYSWLKRRGLPTSLALVVMLVGLTVLFLALFYVLSVSIARFGERVGFYVTQLDVELDKLDALLERLGLSKADLQEVVKPSALADALSVVLSGIAGFLSDLFLILMITLFLLGEGSAMMNRLSSSLTQNNPQLAGVIVVGQYVVRQFGLRALINVITGAGVTALLLVLGVDFAVLWGVLTFFLSFVPYIGLVLAAVPAVVLALAEFGLSRALLVIAGMIVIDTLVENVLSPMMMGHGLSLSPTIVFLSFTFWIWLLGAPGAFLAIPITIFVAVMFSTFSETRWMASLMGVSSPDTGAPAPEAEVERAQ